MVFGKAIPQVTRWREEGMGRGGREGGKRREEGREEEVERERKRGADVSAGPSSRGRKDSIHFASDFEGAFKPVCERASMREKKRGRER